MRPVVAVSVCVAVLSAAASPASAATGAPANLGTGLRALVEQAQTRSLHSASPSGIHMDPAAMAIRDGGGRVLVDVRAAAGADAAALSQRLAGAGLRVTGRATSYRATLIEGFVAISDVTRVATTAGVGAVHLAIKPELNVGSTTSQGVVQHRADRVPRGVNGAGVTVGALSDSFDAATTDLAGNPLAIHAAEDVASGDLPGPGNPANPHPVTVLEDLPRGDFAATDEGRGMLQLVHDMAPGARLCFASAFASGNVGFANNIRGLANPGGPCGADVVVDDVSYPDEPYFEDGVIAKAVDDVAAQGVHYFSSAGNTSSQEGYDATFSPVGGGAAAAAGLDLSGVDPSLYSGGFHDFDPGRSVDVAQSAALTDDFGLLFLQWDDPFDADGPALGKRLLDVTGELTADEPSAEYTFDGTAGEQVVVELDAIPSGTSAWRSGCRPPAPTASKPRASLHRSATSGSPWPRRPAARASRPTSTCCSSTPRATSSGRRTTSTRSAAARSRPARWAGPPATSRS
jgi:hypothetical protein